MPGYNYKEINQPTYNILSEDYFLGIQYTQTDSVTLTLPDISTVGNRLFVITDIGGNSSVNYITILGVNGQKINRAVEKTITENYKSVSLFNDYDPNKSSFNWYVYSQTF